MKVVILSILIGLSIIFNYLNAQRKPNYGKYLIVGTSVTYIPNYENFNQEFLGRFDEITWNVNMGISMTKRLVTGLQLLNIYTIDPYKNHQYYSIYGLFNQFNIAASSNFRAFFEGSVNRGNYCSWGDSLPYTRENTFYYGLGAGLDIPLSKIIKGLYLDLSFVEYFTYDVLWRGTFYNQYIVGLNYRLSQR